MDPLDDIYLMYTEEVDLCYRLAQEEMYLQLYRSKVQFYRKFGGEGRARQAKALLALAYAPRVVLASAAALVAPAWRSHARTWRRLLAELPGM